MAPRGLPIEIKVATRELLAQHEEGELRIELLAEVVEFLGIRPMELEGSPRTDYPEAAQDGEEESTEARDERLLKKYQDEIVEDHAARLGVRLLTDAEARSGLR